MITLVCTKCGTTLNVDDGFAGGVCRCKHCGTIQTVPQIGEKSPAKSGSIFERHSRSSGRELEAFADIVGSSGLAGSGMLQQARVRHTSADAARRRTTLAALLGAAVAVMAGGLWLALNLNHGARKSDKADPSISNPLSDVPPPVVEAPKPVVAPVIPRKNVGPSFGSIMLNASGPAIYLVDRGEATRPFNVSLQKVIALSVSTLGPKRTFQVRYWSADGDSPAFPAMPEAATPATIGRLSTWMTTIADGRPTDAADSLDAALAAKPGEIVIITGRAWQLDDEFANESIAKLAKVPVRVHCVALGGSTGSDALSHIAAKTGGTYVEMDAATLDAIAK